MGSPLVSILSHVAAVSLRREHQHCKMHPFLSGFVRTGKPCPFSSSAIQNFIKIAVLWSPSLKAGPLAVTEKIKVFTLLALKTGPFTDLCGGFHAFTAMFLCPN